VPLPTDTCAAIACNALRVDEEIQADKIRRVLATKGSHLLAFGSHGGWLTAQVL
jgi:hypothetical protein